MDFSMNSPNISLSLYDPSNLVERNFLFATYGFIKTCALGVVAGTRFTCGVIGGTLINKISPISGRDMWAFLNQASGCSNRQTDADTLSSILAAFPANRAGQATITFKGITGTFSFEAVPTGQRGDGNTCGAPATDPSTGTAT
jgi:hypothetical protein